MHYQCGTCIIFLEFNASSISYLHMIQDWTALQLPLHICKSETAAWPQCYFFLPISSICEAQLWNCSIECNCSRCQSSNLPEKICYGPVSTSYIAWTKLDVLLLSVLQNISKSVTRLSVPRSIKIQLPVFWILVKRTLYCLASGVAFEVLSFITIGSLSWSEVEIFPCNELARKVSISKGNPLSP